MNKLATMQLSPVKKDTSRLSEQEARQILTKLPGWVVNEKEGQLQLEKSYPFENYLQGIAFANKIAQVAEKENHHPAILVEWGRVTVTWWSHIIKGLHQNDFIMAAKAEQLFKEMSQGS